MKFLPRPTPDIDGTLNDLFKWVEAPITSWTPVLTFATAGNLSVAYTTQLGRYILLGPIVIYWFNIVTSAFTHTTASGDCQITGLPYTAVNVTGLRNVGTLNWQGITKANYTDIAPHINANATTILLGASGSGQSLANIGTGDMPTGGSVILRGTGIYFRA